MEMHHKSFKDILGPLIGVAGVDEVDIVGDVVNGQVHQTREMFQDCFWICHGDSVLLKSLDEELR